MGKIERRPKARASRFDRKFEFENLSMSSEEGIKVFVRVRPPNEREKQV